MLFHSFNDDDILARLFRWPPALSQCLVAGACSTAAQPELPTISEARIE